MMTIRELCEKHTSLTSADIEKIENMARNNSVSCESWRMQTFY